MARPKIRLAKFGDVPAIYDVIEDAHRRSRYAALSEIDEKEAKALIMQSIQRNGMQTRGGAFVAVADTGKHLEGIIIGGLQPLYLIGVRLEATDLFWITRENAHATTAGRLLKAFYNWVPAGAVIRQANSDLISDIEATGKMLQRGGMRLVGHIYEKVKEDAQ